MANGNQLFTTYDYSKIFIWNKRTYVKTYTNTTGATVNIAAGTLMGTIQSSNKLWPCISTATDGSELPVGFAAANYSVAAGATIQMTIVIGGDVAKEMVTFFNGTDTWSTAVGTAVTGGTLEDLIHRNTQCIIVPGTDQTYLDNQ